MVKFVICSYLANIFHKPVDLTVTTTSNPPCPPPPNINKVQLMAAFMQPEPQVWYKDHLCQGSEQSVAKNCVCLIRACVIKKMPVNPVS